MQLEARDVLLVLGIRGTGKSQWTAREVVAAAPRVMVWDPHAEYPTTTRRNLDHILDAIGADGCSPLLESAELSLSVVPTWRTRAELAEQFDLFVSLVESVGGCVVVVEEAGLLQGNGRETLEYLATQSRHWQTPVVLVAQRATQISKTAREQATAIVSFRQNDPSDVDALVERCGAAAERVRSLPQFESFAWDESQAFDDSPTTGAQKEVQDVC